MTATDSFVFSVQDETGTVAQITLTDSPSPAIAVGDTGSYSGQPDDGTDGFAPPAGVDFLFEVTQVLDNAHFSIHTLTQQQADWPRSGTITWATGANAGQTSTVIEIDKANAYIDEAYLAKYCASRGIGIGSPTVAQQQQAIVQATDYLDQRYAYRGIKLVQVVGEDLADANAIFLEPWLTPYALNQLSLLVPSTTPQETQWPRQGVVDNNGDTVNGIPRVIQMACAELAQRVLNGTVLQPDYDPSIVGNGGIVQSVSNEVGPLKVTTTYDTKMGLGFFARIPHVDRMLSRAGILVQTNRKLIR